MIYRQPYPNEIEGNALSHAWVKKGAMKPGHKYIRREGSSGNYRYYYEDDLKDEGDSDRRGTTLFGLGPQARKSTGRKAYVAPAKEYKLNGGGTARVGTAKGEIYKRGEGLNTGPVGRGSALSDGNNSKKNAASMSKIARQNQADADDNGKAIKVSDGNKTEKSKGKNKVENVISAGVQAVKNLWGKISDATMDVVSKVTGSKDNTPKVMDEVLTSMQKTTAIQNNMRNTVAEEKKKNR